MAKDWIYFDIDGVLNNTPARGDNGFYVDPAKVELLKQLPGPFVCISYWRRRPDMGKIPGLNYQCAPVGNKKDCVNTRRAKLVIDDQPDYYKGLQNVPVYKVDGDVGLTQEDIDKIKRKYFPEPRVDPFKAYEGALLAEQQAFHTAARDIISKAIYTFPTDPRLSGDEVAERIIAQLAEQGIELYDSTEDDWK